MTRYHPVLVALHWLLALMIVAGLLAGGLVLSETPNSDPAKIGVLRAHMTLGLAILVLMLLRLGLRLFTARPPAADAGHPALNRAGAAAHWLLYLLVIAMAVSGIATARLAGLPDIVFGGSGAPLPPDFGIYAPRAAHGLVATLLGLLILAHVAAALYHQLVRKDRLFARMWFGARRG